MSLDHKKMIADINRELALLDPRLHISEREEYAPYIHTILRVIAAHVQGELDVRDVGLVGGK